MQFVDFKITKFRNAWGHGMLPRRLLIGLLAACLSLPAAAQNCDENAPEVTLASRFKTLAEGVVSDKQTGKVWLRCPVGMRWSDNSCGGNSLKYTWSEALVAIEELNAKKFGGRSDWRLPTVEELTGIVEPRCFKPAINLDIFPFSPESGFWTETSVPGIQPRAWVVHFLNGKQYIANKKQSWRIRPVASE